MDPALGDPRPPSPADIAEFILDHAGDLVTTTGPAGRLTYVSSASRTMLGYEPAELLGRPARDLFPAPDGAASPGAPRAAGAGRSLTTRHRARHKDGRWVWLESTSRAMPGAEGALLTVSRDVSARVEAEAQLRGREAQMRTLIEQSPYSIQTYGTDGHILSGNRAWERLFGVTLDEVRDYCVLRDPQLEAAGVMPLIRRAFAGELVVLPPTPWRPDRGARAGQLLVVQATMYPVKDEDGVVRQVVLMHEDITERQHAKDALQAQRDLYDTLLTAAGELGEGVGLTDGPRFLYANEAYARLTGYSVEELTAPGFDVACLVSDRTRELAERRIEAVRARDEAPAHYEIWLRRKDGSEIPVELVSKTVASGGRSLRFSIIRDISARVQAEEGRALFAQLVEYSGDFIGIGAADGRCMYLNPAGRDLVGLGDRALPERVLDFVAAEARPFVEHEVLAHVLRDGRWEGEVELRHFTTDERIPVHEIVFLLPARAGEPPLMAVIARDLRERREAQRELEAARVQLARSERLAALGTLVSGLAHEVRTPLTVLANAAQLVETRVRPKAGDPVLAAALDDVGSAIARINHLVGDLRRFTRMGPVERAPRPLDAVVSDAVHLFQTAQRPELLEVDLAPTPPVAVDRAQVQQVTLNLLQNAWEAARLAGGGARLAIRTRPSPDGGATLVVEDEGPGIPQDVQERMWEPLYTTKPEGTGLGLSIVRRIVDDHGARIRCESRPGQGARFVVDFPPAA